MVSQVERGGLGLAGVAALSSLKGLTCFTLHL
jgi:hypothetical protein